MNGEWEREKKRSERIEKRKAKGNGEKGNRR